MELSKARVAAGHPESAGRPGPGSPGDAGLELRAVRRFFGKVVALDEVSITVHPREFLTLLGPSGCGKTTLLRIIAGLDRPSSGQVLIDGQNVTQVRPNRRPTNIVFQRAALFPHLNVFDNVAFGLRMERLDKREVRRRVSEALDMVRLSGLEQRRSHELSGGQVQRVALARAIVKRPQVLLFDEPLSALDLKIRLAMEAELRRIHAESESIFVYVTHDQREALALSDRIAVMDHGVIRQLDVPEQLYRHPANPFVAGFVGDANVIPVQRSATLDGVFCGSLRLPHSCAGGACAGSAWLVVRPTSVRLGAGSGPLEGIITDVAYRGSANSYVIDVAGLPEPIKAEIAGEDQARHVPGKRVSLDWDPHSSICLFREQ
jgi:ABC-type Fe3+/spermidine/putrescine transport system ATPase subunit